MTTEEQNSENDDIHSVKTLGELLDFISQFPRDTHVCGIHNTYPMPLDVWECCGELRFE